MFYILTQSARAEGNFVESDLFGSLKEGEKGCRTCRPFRNYTRRYAGQDNRRRQQQDSGSISRHRSPRGLDIPHHHAPHETRGLKRLSPEEALRQLKTDGYTHILIQSSNIIEGIEMESLRKDVAAQEKDFKEIRISTPLLFSPGDYEAVIAAITPKGIKDGAVLLVGHGTYTPNTAQYAMLDYMLKAKGSAGGPSAL